MPAFFSRLKEYENKSARALEVSAAHLDECEQEELKREIQKMREELAHKKQEAQSKLDILKQEIEQHVDELEIKQKVAIRALLQQTSVAIEMSTHYGRIDELLSIATWADNVVLGKPWESEDIFPLLATELDRWGGLYNHKITRVLIGLGAIILGLAAIALAVYLCIQFAPIGEYSPLEFSIGFGVVLGLGSIIWGLSTIFSEHDYNLSSELKEFTQCFESSEGAEEGSNPTP